MQSYLKVLVLAGILTGAASVLAEDAVPQIFELKNGDRITATVQSQSETNMVVLTPFGGTLTLPLDQITKQSPLPSPEEIAAEAEKAAKAEAEKAAEAADAEVEEAKKIPDTFLGKFFSNLAGEVQLGMDAGYGASDYMNYYGRVKASHGVERWKSLWDGKLTYGKNKGVVSADKLDTSYRLEFDAIQDKLFLYGEPTGGYDTIRNIDYYYTIGGGLGYHILKKDNVVFDASAGVSHQSYHYSNEGTRNGLYVDLGESLTWEIIKDPKFLEKLTYSPKANDWNVYRITFETGLSWGFYKNMTFNFTLIEKYDSRPAAGVDHNDLQLVSSIGLKF